MDSGTLLRWTDRNNGRKFWRTVLKFKMMSNGNINSLTHTLSLLHVGLLFNLTIKRPGTRRTGIFLS